jgi:hypothetical protein
MPTQKEHRLKYLENKNVLDKLFDANNKEHSNWITTICFYTALHIVEYEFAAINISNSNYSQKHSKDHAERQENMINSGMFDPKILSMYKQMNTNSRVARYKADNITPTIANMMLNYLKKIEQEFGFPKVC